MHYCCYLYTKDFPTNKVIEKALKPYEYKDGGYDDGEQRPLFTWDWWQVGGRYGGKLKLNIKAQDGADKYETEYLVRYRRAGRLFRCKLLEETTRGILDHGSWKETKADESEALNYCGMRDGILYVDGAWANDIQNLTDEADNCWAVIDTDGTAIARNHWDGADWKDDDRFSDKAKAIAMKNKADTYVTVVDIHD